MLLTLPIIKVRELGHACAFLDNRSSSMKLLIGLSIIASASTNAAINTIGPSRDDIYKRQKDGTTEVTPAGETTSEKCEEISGKFFCKKSEELKKTQLENKENQSAKNLLDDSDQDYDDEVE